MLDDGHVTDELFFGTHAGCDHRLYETNLRTQTDRVVFLSKGRNIKQAAS